MPSGPLQQWGHSPALAAGAPASGYGSGRGLAGSWLPSTWLTGFPSLNQNTTGTKFIVVARVGAWQGAYWGMADSDDFLAWVRSTLYDAEVAIHNGDARPRRAIWSRNEPVSVLGAWRNAFGQQELHELFTGLAQQFANCTSYEFELLAYDVVGDMAYTAGLEHTSATVDGEPRSYVLRVTQVYRRENGEWKVAHRHGDTVTRAS